MGREAGPRWLRWPLRWSLVSVMLSSAAAACGSGDVFNVERGATPEQQAVAVHVINESRYSARVHAVYAGGQRFAIGTIDNQRPHGETLIPWQPRALRLEVDLVIGPGVYLSDEVDVFPGDVVELRIPANIESSGFFRRIRD